MSERRRRQTSDPGEERSYANRQSDPRNSVGTAREHLNSEIEAAPEGHEGARWLEMWERPLIARKPADLDRIIEMLQRIDEYMILEVGGVRPCIWANSYMGQTLAGLLEELKRVNDGGWSKVLQPDKSRRGNWRQGLSFADERMRQEAIFGVDYFLPAFGSKSAAQTEIAKILSELGIAASRPTLVNWHKDLTEKNLILGRGRSRFFAELPEDLRLPSNITSHDQVRLRDLMKRVLRPIVGDRETDLLAEKSAKDSGQ